MTSPETERLTRLFEHILRLLIEGDFEQAQKELQPPEKFEKYAFVAETLAILGIKLEAEEFSLHEKLREVKKLKNLLQIENRDLKRKLEATQSIFPITNSLSLAGIIRMVERIAPTDATVIISGESGTGKEVLAQLVHQMSLRKNKAFIALNCAALPESLLEAELFGIEKGVATGVSPRIGKFEAANSGTIFLDEIADMSLSTQVKVLRVIQEMEVVKVGSATPKKIDIRIIAASQKNLGEAISNGTFREDLYFRLNVISIHLPPLRERRDDILPMANYFLTNFSTRYHRNIKGFAKESQELLRTYRWPGNIRELKNSVERAVLVCETEWIDPAAISLNETALVSNLPPETTALAGKMSAPNRLRLSGTDEKMRIIDTLSHFQGSRNKTAQFLGIHRETLRLKMKRYGLG